MRSALKESPSVDLWRLFTKATGMVPNYLSYLPSAAYLCFDAQRKARADETVQTFAQVRYRLCEVLRTGLRKICLLDRF